MNAERLVRIERGARGPRIFRHQLEIAEGGDQGHDERHQEWQPYGAADLPRDLPGERVNPGAENVADDEQEEQPWAHDTSKAGLSRGVGLAAAPDRHVGHPILSLLAQNRSASDLAPVSHGRPDAFNGLQARLAARPTYRLVTKADRLSRPRPRLRSTPQSGIPLRRKNSEPAEKKPGP